jgi:hypothetical protein
MRPPDTDASRIPKARFGALYRSLFVTVGLPFIALQLLLHRGWSPISALTVAAIFPFAAAVVSIVRTRRVEVLAALSLAGILAGIGLSLLTGNAVFAIVKDSLLTGVIGTLFLASLAGRRPLIFRLAGELYGDDQVASAAHEALWNWPAARHTFRLLTLVWGVGLWTEALTRVVVALTLPAATAAALSPAIALVAIGALTVWTVLYSNARRRAGAEAMRLSSERST